MRLVLLLACAFSAVLPASARLVWEATELRVDAPVGAEEVVGVFRFRNAGETPIEITRTQTSCGCTVSELPQTRYAPGESGELTARLHIGSREGLQENTITVSTDDAATGAVQLRFSSLIQPALSVNPRVLVWNLASDDPAGWLEAQVTLADGCTLELDPLEREGLPFEVETVADSADPAQVVVRVRPRGTPERGTWRLSLAAKRDGETLRAVRLHFLVR